MSLQWLDWRALVADQRARGTGITTLLARAVRSRRLARAQRHLPLSEADRVATGRTLPWWQQWLAHADSHDGFWDDRDWSSAVARLRAPIVMITSWNDHFLPWQLADWAQLPADTARRLVIAPWVHEDPRTLRLYLREAVGWLRAHVYGDTGDLPGGPVRYYVGGAGRWRDARSWPPAGTIEEHWYLQADGCLSMAEPSTASSSGYRYDPGDPTPVVGGPSARGTPWKSQHRVEARDDVLVFTSEPLHAPLEIAGAPHAVVHLRSSVAHTDVVVRLCDVDTRGRSRNVCDGIRRVHLPDLPSDDGVHAVDVAMWPTAHRFDGGHRLRVQIASAAFPRYARNLGTGEPTANATGHVVADHQIHHAPTRASHITLPTVSDSVVATAQ